MTPYVGTTCGQAGQDWFVMTVLDGLRGGTFLDIGCNHPIACNNTYIAESCFGWTGLSVDRLPDHYEAWRQYRNTPLVVMDALDLVTTLPQTLTTHGLPMSLDYISLDIDDSQLLLVQRFPWETVGARVMTVEHDSYRFGDAFRDGIRHVLHSHGYTIVCKDVMCAGHVFEDWWVNPRLMPDTTWQALTCTSLDDTSIRQLIS